jgi:CHAD domain-containing protein
VLPRWSDRFRQAAAELSQSVGGQSPGHSRNRDTLGALGRAVLRDRLGQLLAAVRSELSDLAEMHRLRIAAKRLRYVMEVFAGCYPAGFRGRLYSQVETIQSELGHINDLRHLRQTLAELRAEVMSRGGLPGRAAAERIIRQIREERAEELRRRQAAFILRWNSRLRRELRRQAERLFGRQRAIM